MRTDGREPPVSILVVDDHPENILALEAILDEPSYRIQSASSGEEALKLVLKHDFAVILLDVLMPRMDGFETARTIRLREASRGVPIIFLTAVGTDLSFIYRGYSVGAVDYLIKPLDADIVRAKVAVFVDLWRKREQILRQEAQLRQIERERSEEALRERDAQYDATFREAPVGIGHLSSRGEWLRVNPKLCEILGYPADELLRRRFQDIAHMDDLGDDVLAFHQLLVGEADTIRRERRLVTHAGESVWTHVTISPLSGAAEGRRLIAVVEDISDRKQAEKTHRLIARASEILLSSMEIEPVVGQIAQLVVPRLADACAIEILGDEGDESEPRITVAAHVDDAGAESLRELAATLAGAANPGAGAAPEFLFADPDEIDQRAHPALAAQLRGARFRSALAAPLAVRGRHLGVLIFGLVRPGRRYRDSDIAVARDLAQRVAFAADNARLYRQLRRALAARDEFLSIASHELRTPLSTLGLQCQLLNSELRGEALSRDRVGAIVQRAERQLRRLGALVESLLDVTRIASGKLALQLDEFDLGEVTKDVVSRLADEASRTGSSITVDICQPVVGIWDRFRLEQVVTNLLSNAIKYGDGKPVRIWAEADETRGLLRVQDQGIGIEATKVDRIFDRFERAVSSRSFGGLGLGLYISRQIIEAHGGRIAVVSEVGRGSTFTVELPLHMPASASAPEPRDVDRATASA